MDAYASLLVSNTANLTATLALTVPARGVSAGETLVIAVSWTNDAVSVSGIADTQGNVYARDLDSGDGGATKFTRLQIWRSTVRTSLLSGNIITITYSGGTPFGNCAISAVLSNAKRLTLDQSASANADNTTTPSSGTTASLAAAGEMVIGAIGYVLGSTSLGSLTAGFTTLDSVSSTGGSGQVLTMGWELSPSTSGVVYAGTLSPLSEDNSAAVIAYAFDDSTPRATPYGGNPFLNPLEKRRYVD